MNCKPADPAQSSRKKTNSRIAFVSILCCACSTALVLAGCANPVNARTAENYYSAGISAEEQGDIDVAREKYRRAFRNAEMGFLGPKAKAYSLYEYARLSGYAKDYTEAEKSFKMVLDFITEARGEADNLRAPALSEYAYMLHDIGQHGRAVELFEQAIPELERRNIVRSDPIGYAALLDDFEHSLKQSGKADRAREIQTTAARIRSENKTAPLKFKRRQY